jgi:hypothetical protein
MQVYRDEAYGRRLLTCLRLGIGLAAFGLLNPLVAAFIHVASELAFILNSARLLPVRSSGTESTTHTWSAAEPVSTTDTASSQLVDARRARLAARLRTHQG